MDGRVLTHVGQMLLRFGRGSVGESLCKPFRSELKQDEVAVQGRSWPTSAMHNVGIKRHERPCRAVQALWPVARVNELAEPQLWHIRHYFIPPRIGRSQLDQLACAVVPHHRHAPVCVRDIVQVHDHFDQVFRQRVPVPQHRQFPV